ncbi:DUF3322 and DUF2220 domain-containing protein [Luteipulveratus mongoliensis]|uniref:DUF3322 and DUF2220 domain-containing protein n=1 Tax=Luteipulveratus mongoliensis TaxID=571913 RepID=UPI0009F9C5B6|nr:DUF3322 and DUF2220 domain-containing protein [Luteipulveratus mongoliensis]
MKTLEEAREGVRKWLGTHLSSVVAGVEPSPWTAGRSVPLLGTVSKTTLQTRWPDYQAWARTWFDWTLPAGVGIDEVIRKVGLSDQPLPTHLQFADIETMCRFAQGDWTARLIDLGSRWESIRQRFPAAPDAISVLRRTRNWDDADVTTLLNVAQWFQENPNGWQYLTPRQIPLPGVHGKWLNAASRHREITALTGIGPIELLGRPATIRFSYCDPAHLAAGGRRHDTWVRGDVTTLAYTPTTVLIVENQDTYFYFPQQPGLIVVWGVGDMAPARLAECEWVAGADNVIYWGDIDADGYRILDSLRARIRKTRSILMHLDAYTQYEVYGTNTDRGNQPIKAGLKWKPADLTTPELEVLLHITAEDHRLHRRVEQERIPLDAAVGELELQRRTALTAIRDQGPSSSGWS